VGNHNIAGWMHRHHLTVMLYEPRRPAIYADNIGRGRIHRRPAVHRLLRLAQTGWTRGLAAPPQAC
jgi:hypothetical protein